MANTNLTQELALRLLRRQAVICPKCGKDLLCSRYSHKNINTEYKCAHCGEIYKLNPIIR